MGLRWLLDSVLLGFGGISGWACAAPSQKDGFGWPVTVCMKRFVRKTRFSTLVKETTKKPQPLKSKRSSFQTRRSLARQAVGYFIFWNR